MDNDYKTKPLHIMLPKTTTHVRSYDGETQWIFFSIEDDELLKKYNNILEKVSTSIKKEFSGELVYNKKFLKIKIKSYGDEATDFCDKRNAYSRL